MAADNAVFIWAPTQRCGTGLLQRLVTSSREVLVFGEDRHIALDLPGQLLHCSRPLTDQSALRERLASGDLEGWYVHVYPPADAYRVSLIQNFNTLAALYTETARSHGFSRWGTKYPDFQLNEAQVLSKLLPGARHLFIYRDIVDVLRSVKARGWLTSPQVAVQYARQWVRGVNQALSNLVGDERFHMIRYEDLVARPGAHLPDLAAFLGVSALDARVFSHRTNAPSGYTAPLALTPAELAAADRIARPLRDMLGYTESVLRAAK
ncbi:MAG: hypothetical protein ACI8S6_001045 [Myxococcota bacterium]|jgi:hypothetical protein